MEAFLRIALFRFRNKEELSKKLVSLVTCGNLLMQISPK